MKKFSTRELVNLSLLIALNIVLSRVASMRINIGSVEGIRIGFGSFPVILAGIIFGPAAGGIVGAIGDMVGYYINPAGAYVPLFTISAALTGIIPSLVLKLTKHTNWTLWQLIIAIGIGQFITSIILTPYFLQLAFNIPFFATLPARIVAQAINVPVYAVLAQRIKKKADIILN